MSSPAAKRSFDENESARICKQKRKDINGLQAGHESSIQETGTPDRPGSAEEAVADIAASESTGIDSTAVDHPDDREYFDSYSQLDIHRTMIGDYERTQTYRHAILTGYPLIRGKTVLDVGCGTGILSVFCCQAGARHVYACEASAAGAAHARAVVAENEYTDRVTVINCRAEQLELPGKVDVIVSEWMGHALLYESMLDAVLAARDKWLKPDGVLFPERAVLKLALTTAPVVDDAAAHFWTSAYDKYRVKMSCLAGPASAPDCTKAQVVTVLPEEVHSHAVEVCSLDLRSVPASKVRSVRSAQLRLASFGADPTTSLALWFDVHFPGGDVLSTSPYKPATHWAQALLPLPQPWRLQQGEDLSVQLSMHQDEKHPRNWNVKAQVKRTGGDVVLLQWALDGTA